MNPPTGLREESNHFQYGILGYDELIHVIKQHGGGTVVLALVTTVPF